MLPKSKSNSVQNNKFSSEKMLVGKPEFVEAKADNSKAKFNLKSDAVALGNNTKKILNSRKFDAQITQICQNAKLATSAAVALETATKNQILQEVILNLQKNQKIIFAANQIDLQNAKRNGLSSAKIDRLTFDKTRLEAVCNSISEIIKLPNPVGRTLHDAKLANGLRVQRVSTPIGVLLAIYESRPNVTSDIAALSIKSGNVAILRCGSDCLETSTKIAEIFCQAIRLTLESEGKNEEEIRNAQNMVILCKNPDRRYVSNLLKMEKFIDVVIPRGGKSLIKAVMKSTKIPVFRHLDGNCHTYIHKDCDFEKARKILVNAKMRRVGICGATESVLIDDEIATKILPKLIDDLVKLGCEIRGDKASIAIDGRIVKAKEQDFYTEYLDKILSLKIVKNIDEAIRHINHYGSSHTESIITENSSAAQKFMNEVDSAIVMHNASTQFADGFEMGLGAEVGIATGKLHARGPVGLEQLTTYKYKVEAECGLRTC